MSQQLLGRLNFLQIQCLLRLSRSLLTDQCCECCLYRNQPRRSVSSVICDLDWKHKCCSSANPINITARTTSCEYRKRTNSGNAQSMSAVFCHKYGAIDISDYTSWKSKTSTHGSDCIIGNNTKSVVMLISNKNSCVGKNPHVTSSIELCRSTNSIRKASNTTSSKCGHIPIAWRLRAQSSDSARRHANGAD